MECSEISNEHIVVTFHFCSCDKHKPFFYWTIVAQQRWGCKENQDKLYASLLGNHKYLSPRTGCFTSQNACSPVLSGLLFRTDSRTSPRVPDVFLSLQSKWNNGVICSTIHHVCFPLHLNAL